jgi:orotidine-5'-phosphate decarboxylase
MRFDPREQLIVALDVPSQDAALALVERLGDEVLWYKVGLELFGAAGPPMVTALKQAGKRVFLDLKLHDIPNTVARAVACLAGLGADLIDLHTVAGSAAMEAAARALREACPSEPRPQLIGVTVLTSTRELAGSSGPAAAEAVTAEVLRRATAAQAAGLDGVVAPAVALAEIRRRCGEGLAVVTPGIRPAGAATQDQRWIATPASAVAAGARWIVIGRPISAAPDPPAAARAVRAEMAAAFDGVA